MSLDFSSNERLSATIASIVRGGAPLLAGALCLCAASCAEVTQDEPESQLGGNATGVAGGAGSGLGGSGLGSAGQGGTGLLPLGGSSGRGGASAGGTSNVAGTPGSSVGGAGNGGGSSTPGGSGGASGSAGQGGSAPDLGPQFPSGTELLREDFESDDVSRWTLAGGSWARTLDAETNSNVFSQSEDSSSDVLLAVSGDVSWRDVRVEADFRVLAFNGSSSSYMAGICVRLTDADNFYLVGLRGDSNQHFGIRRFGSSNTNLNQSEVAGEENVWYHLRVDAFGNTLSVYVDDALVVEQTDAEHPVGGIGLCTARATAVFDNVVVSAP